MVTQELPIPLCALGAPLALALVLGMPLSLTLAATESAADPVPDAPSQAPKAMKVVAIAPDQRSAFGIEVAAPEAADASLGRRYPGRVAVPNAQLRVVATPQAGVVETLLVAEGERVEVGQVLARLASPELVDAQSAYLEALTRLELAASELDRDTQLHREGIVAERRLIETRSHHRELATLAEQRRQLLALAGLSESDIARLADTRRLSGSLEVRAPIAGVVLEQQVAAGESVSAAAPLYRVGQLNPLWVEVHVPVDRLGGVGPGSRALLPALRIEAQVVTVGRLVHAQDQGVLVRAEVTEGSERLRPGQFVEVQLASAADGRARWRLPAAAVVREGGRAYVFAERPGGFAALPVEVLAEEERAAVVAGALGADDRVATSGTVALKAAWLAGGEN